MTTRVTVDPAGHDIEVSIEAGGTLCGVDTLKAGSHPKEYWIYGDRSITIREVMVTGPDLPAA